MRETPFTVENFFRESLQSQLLLESEHFRLEAERVGKAKLSLGLLEATLLQTLVRSHQGQKWIEVGTLTGFSAFCISSVLPTEGHLWTFEKNRDYATSAKSSFSKFQLNSKITLVEGDAAVSLSTIESNGPFDGIFIDGNKGAYLAYLQWAMKNLRPGALVIADNVFLDGATMGQNQDTIWGPGVQERMREFISLILNPKYFTGTVIPTPAGLAVGVLK